MLFDYTGQLQTGAMFQGTLEAEAIPHAEATLRDMGIRVTSLQPARRTGFLTPLSLDDFQFLNEQIASMTRGGVPLEVGLRHLAADSASPRLKRVLSELAEALATGSTLEQAIAAQSGRFPAGYGATLRAGLRTGDVGGTLYALAATLRLHNQFRRALLELAVYPLVILAFSLALLSFLMRTVVPQLQDCYEQFGWFARSVGMNPPVASMNLVGMLVGTIFWLSHVWPSVELVALVLFAAICLLALMLRSSRFAALREWILLRIPGIAQVYWSGALARFTHTSALAATSGVPMPELLNAAGAASGSPALASASREVASRVEMGQSLVDASACQRLMPGLWTCVASTSAARGDMPAALEELARTYEVRGQHYAGVVRVMLGPLLLLFVGSTIGVVIFGLLAPMISLIRSLTN